MLKSELEQVTSPESSSRIVCSLDEGLTTQEHVKLCCQPRYRMRMLKNKGAILLVVCTYLVTAMFYINRKVNADGNFALQFDLQLVAGGITLTIAGWLADVYFGRFKVVHMSVWVMWTAYMLATASTIVTLLVESYSHVGIYVTKVLTIVSNSGLLFDVSLPAHAGERACDTESLQAGL